MMKMYVKRGKSGRFNFVGEVRIGGEQEAIDLIADNIYKSAMKQGNFGCVEKSGDLKRGCITFKPVVSLFKAVPFFYEFH